MVDIVRQTEEEKKTQELEIKKLKSKQDKEETKDPQESRRSTPREKELALPTMQNVLTEETQLTRDNHEAMPTEKDDQEEKSWEEEELALKNNSKNLEPKIDKLKKLEQEKKNLEKEVHEVQTKLNAALTIIKDERKVNEIDWKRIKNLQSLYESSEEEIANNLSIQSL